MAFAPIKDGEFTSTIYGMINDSKYNDVIRILQYELQRSPTNRAALSLLGYCYYFTQDFINAVECYEQLTQHYPTFPEYRVYLAQSLYNASMTPDAMAVVSTIEEPELLGEVVKMEAAIKFQEGDYNNARILVEQYAPDDPDMEVNLACIDYVEGSFDKALQRFGSATKSVGYQPDLSYAIALCHYRKKEFPQALKLIAEIIDRGVKDHPELGVGMTTEGLEMQSVGNTILLHESALIEAFNLKFAVEYKLRNMTGAGEALTDMPPRAEEELDPVTLHNQALIGKFLGRADIFEV